MFFGDVLRDTSPIIRQGSKSSLHHNKMAILKNSFKEQSKNITGENIQRERPEEELSKPKASTYLTFKESVSSLNEHLISTISKQHSTLRQPSEVYYQNQRKTGTMQYTN